jgi:tetratricopeptide (TPR) repeat protein
VKTVYTARDAAQILGLPESRVRYWAQTGFVGPSAKSGGRGVYTFQDLIGLKAAKELLDSGVSMQRARKNLEALRAQLPNLDLARVRIVSDGERLVCVGESTPFEPLSGQLVMDFATGALEGRVAEVMNLRADEPARPDATESAYAWFLEGVRLDGDPALEERALAAYQKALAADPQLAAAHTNLGALLHRRGELGRAREHFEQALALDPEQPEARYNLANLLDDLGEREQAVGEWYRVLAACPEFADAHFNLAMALLGDGGEEGARTHLGRYLALDEEGEWAERARLLLASLAPGRL